ncbi:transposase [Streptomyces sp. NPDC018045]|uniref:transposase n=1 Tax=Streptomyces sp. NPDC018045 TaxID=3365037 RepID=UPI003793AFD7
MVRRHELTDAQWLQIKPLLPANGSRRAGSGRITARWSNGVLFRARTGAPWPDLNAASLWRMPPM